MAKLFNSAFKIILSKVGFLSALSMKNLSSAEKNILGQLKSIYVCLFLIILLQPKRGKKRIKIRNFFFILMFVII